MSTRLLCCLLLMCASFPLMASDARMMGANGNGGGNDTCQDSITRNDEPSIKPGSSKPATPAIKARTKPGASSRTAGGGASDNLGDVRPPRWHSFLPGMFR